MRSPIASRLTKAAISASDIKTARYSYRRKPYQPDDKHAQGRDMARSPSRITRGFHRLGLFLAAIPLRVGILWPAFLALSVLNVNRENGVSLHDFYINTFFPWVGFGLAMALPVALAVYALVRGIGWVVDGFAG